MEGISNKTAIVIVLIVAMILASTGICFPDDDENPSPIGESPVTPAVTLTPEPVVITIGNLSDLTGVAANAMNGVNMALEDTISYYNESNVIPGVTFELITYDGQFDPSRDIAGYEWLKGRGASFIFTPIPSTTETLKARLTEDSMVLFSLTPSVEGLQPPGHAFCTGNAYARHTSYTLLEWIAENDPDFPTDRPARIGGAYWAEAYVESILRGAEEYVKAHPDRYEWAGGHLTNFTFTWGPEVEDLKDCDYVLPPVPMNSFVKEFRAGYSAKFIGTDAHVAFLGLIDDAHLWDEVDGTIIIQPPWWWNEQGAVIDFTRQLLYKYHADEAEEIIRSGNGYLSVMPIYIMFEIIADAVKAVGPENFNSRALYEAAESFSMIIDDYSFSFNETKRTAIDCFGVYEIRAAEEDVFRINSDWIPIVTSP